MTQSGRLDLCSTEVRRRHVHGSTGGGALMFAPIDYIDDRSYVAGKGMLRLRAPNYRAGP